MTLLGIYRESIFSPGKIEQDTAILDATLSALSRQGSHVHPVSAEVLDDLYPRPGFVLSMAQSARVLRILEGWHLRGTRIINTVRSVRNCTRKRLFHLLAEARMPVPVSRLIAAEKLGEVVFSHFSLPCWLKRGDVHAMEKGDVVRVASGAELEKAHDHFRRRGIEEILVQEHVAGEEIKFYGIGAGAFFRAFRVTSGDRVTREAEPLAHIARRASSGVGLEIYGGDAILTPEGKMVLIDLNDWPSFSHCCVSAAAGIATYVSGKWDGGLHE